MGLPQVDTRFLTWMGLKEIYQDKPEAFLQATQLVANDFQSAMKGIEVQDELGINRQVRLLVTGIKGDWPFLIEVAALERHFRRAPKKGISNMIPTGICHLCLAGVEGVPFSDCSDKPKFEEEALQYSAAALSPWHTLTPFTMSLPCYHALPASLYKPDMWHNWHLGLGRYFLASSLVLLAELESGGVIKRLRSLSARWLSWCQKNSKRPLYRRFTRENLGFLTELDWPEGGWQKASTTCLLMDARMHSRMQPVALEMT